MRCIVFLFLSCLWLTVMANPEKNIYGYIEHVTLLDKDLVLPAKLDTGAKSASLNAEKIHEVKINGKTYLNFIVPSKVGDIHFQAEYIGNVNIKSRTGEKLNPLAKKTINRPVVLMNVKLGSKQRLIRVNLTNRKRFIYPLLLGREAIIDFNGIVDPTLKYTIKDSEG